MNITKIKYKPSPREVEIHWTLPGKAGIDERSLKTKDAPHPDFLEALEALAPVVEEACDWSDCSIEVRGLTIGDAYNKDGDPEDGVTISALRKLDWTSTPMNVNTPFCAIGDYPHYNTDLLVGAMRREAEEFVNGKRRQGDLFVAPGGAIGGNAVPTTTAGEA